MHFDYQSFDTETHYGLRFYKTPVGLLPSITTVLGLSASEEKKQSLQQWRDSIGHAEADAISKHATDHGTAVHLLAERFLKGEAVDQGDVGQEDLAAFNSIRLLLKNINPWCQEQSIYSPSLEIAGRFDCIGEFNEKPSIIDFKTSRKLKDWGHVHDYKLQLAFYAFAHNELFKTNIRQGVIIMASGDGFPQKFIIPDVYVFLDELCDRTERFWQVLAKQVQTS
jgi:genome maintenance exonuclease 1